jgi:cytochrome c peroxidase
MNAIKKRSGTPNIYVLFVLMMLIPLVIIWRYDKRVKRTTAAARAKNVQTRYLANLDQLDNALSQFETLLKTSPKSSPSVAQKAFLQARLFYKQIEFLTEYYYPSTAKLINGPALERVEEDDPTRRVIPPEGFQVIEALLFPEMQTDNLEAVLEDLSILRANLQRVRQLAVATSFSDTHIFDAMRLEVVRVIALGLAGFDSPAALNTIPEAVAAFQALRKTLQYYEQDLAKANFAVNKQLTIKLEHAIAFLAKENYNFNRFNRLQFILEYANPISALLYEAQQALQIPLPMHLRPFSAQAKKVFDQGAFDPSYYAPSYTDGNTEARAELGRLLFFDPILSGNHQRPCASCHQPARAFTDGRKRGRPFQAHGKRLRNTPTVINAGLQSAYFYDHRTAFLEDQAAAVVANLDEMHGSLRDAVATIRQSPEYVERFEAAFGEAGEKAISEQNLRVALASYIRSLFSFDSPFDKLMRGDTTQLAISARNGFNLFMGKAKCGTCHFMPLFNGTVPPTFSDSESEILGVPQAPDTADAKLDPDVGRYALHQIELDRFAFKTPTLRNIELTAPYMHNGVFQTLEEVVDFYNRGGGQGIGISLPHQTLPSEPLQLTAAEIQDIIAFMKSLTDTTGLTARPAKLPAFPNSPRLSRRKIGGKY